MNFLLLLLLQLLLFLLLHLHLYLHLLLPLLPLVVQVWHLTGGLAGGLHLTDVTNASRTMLMDIVSLQWSDSLKEFFSLPAGLLLPAIQASSSHFGSLSCGPLAGCPILGVLGDQQAALLGQGCVARGEAKNTYGTGCFMLYHTGEEPVVSTHGLLTTVAYQVTRCNVDSCGYLLL